MASTSTSDLPLGTSLPYARMHTIIRRVCYVLLFALVIEGALTFPLLAIWYGFPQLSATEVCSELQKVMYSDRNRECQQPYEFPAPPLRGPAEAEHQTTAQDIWGVQPKPLYRRIEFRELVENKRRREAGDTTTTTADQRGTGQADDGVGE